jgi:peptidoglycan-associated lipoprotein
MISAVWLIAAIIIVQSCGVDARIKRADKKYAIGEYYNAGAIYKNAYPAVPLSKKPLKAYAAFRQAECYRLTGAPAKAVNAYIAAIRYKYGDSIVYLNYAKVLQQTGNYAEALNNYRIYLKSHSANQLAVNGATACTKLAEWKKTVTPYVVRRADEFNQKGGTDFCPVFAEPDGSLLFISTSRPGGSALRKASPVTGFSQNDLFYSQKNISGKWERPRPVEGGFNTDWDEGAASFTADGKTVYFTRCPVSEDNPLGAQIYTSSRSGGQWTEPHQVVLFKDSSITAAHPAISANGDTLYFVSDKNGGYGGKDIWYSVSPKGGSWSTPENLGADINTAGDEMFPYVHPDGSLYFSSNGHPGLGGLDIFHAVRTGKDNWKVENLLAPINSNSDDFGITFEKGKQSGFFSSNRGETKGYDKIWSFGIPVKEYTLTGQVTDNKKQILGEAIVRIVGTNGANAKIRTKKDGTYLYKLDPGVDYVLLATCRGYLNQENHLSTMGVKESKAYKVNFQLAAIGKPIQLNNIFYEFGKWTLTKESENALNALVKVLKDNPNITIEISAHTDMVGAAEFNQTLSEKRAQSVVDYLIKSGIDTRRLSSKGYGKSMPVTVDATMASSYPFLKEGTVLDENFVKTLKPDQQEIANQINRRTEFRVVKTTFGLH